MVLSWRRRSRRDPRLNRGPRLDDAARGVALTFGRTLHDAMAGSVSERVLLEGMWFSLEQCGRLLRDAVNLFEGGSDPTAVGLAMLAREEMGKARILRDLW